MRISDLMAQRRVTPFQWRVIALGFLVVTLDGLDTAAIGYLAPAIRAEWGLTPASLGTVFGAGLAGLMLGCLLCGPLADRMGRKGVLIGSALIFGAGSVASALARSPEQLIAARLLTGIGLGGATPTAITLSAEYSAQRLRALLTTLTNCGLMLGFALGGEVVAQTAPYLGWRGILAAGGIAPLLIVPVLLRWLPESMRYLAARGDRPGQLLAIARQIDPQVERIDPEPSAAPHERAAPLSASGRWLVPIQGLFAPDCRVLTLMLWAAFFFSLCAFYLLTSWLPLVVRDAGYALAHAARIGAMFPLGSAIGAVALGYAMDRVSAARLLAATYCAGGAALCVLGLVTHQVAALMAVVFVAGVGVGGAQTGLNALTATFYPTESRATGVAWAFGVGRIGSIFGSGVGGVLIAATATTAQAFRWVAVAPFIAAALMLMIARHQSRPRAQARLRGQTV